MALDGIFLTTVKRELQVLVGGRVDKIYQPAREEIIMSVRTREAVYKLLFNASANNARVHITDEQIENPKTPPMFCMLLRKRLSSGKLAAVRQDGCERVLYFDIDCVSELGEPCRLTLAAEIMGRCSNLILIGDNGRILDCIKRVTLDLSSVRPVLPGMVYEPPARQERMDIFSYDRGALADIISDEKNTAKPLSKALVAAFEGFSPLFAREAEYAVSHGEDMLCGDMDSHKMDSLCNYLDDTARALSEGKNRFTIIKDKDGVLKEYCFTQILQYGSLMTNVLQNSACETLDRFYSQRDADSRRRQWAADLFKLLTRTEERISRRVAGQKQELEQCAKRDELKLCGDLIMANLYRLEKGQTEAEVENLYDEDCRKITIKLDKRLTPVQNAQRYYAEYRKADTAEKKLTQLIAEGEEELAYIDSVSDSLMRASGEDDIALLREELEQEGYIRRKVSNKKAVRQQKPLRFVSDGGFEILVGRNNRQNDSLTLKESKKDDIWLHVHNIAGSHTIISCGGKQPDEQTLMQAARLAALYSKARNSSQVPVDYTQVRYVHKPAGAKPGMVIFTNNKTLFVEPDEQEAERLAANVPKK